MAKRPPIQASIARVPVSAQAGRPFYGRFAWAYDLLSARPVAAEGALIASMTR